MRYALLFLLLVSFTPSLQAADKRSEWRVSLHEPVLCIWFCNEDERDPKNIEVALASFEDDSAMFREWVGSVTVSPGRWRYEFGGPLHDVYLTQAGVLWGMRSPGPVNFIAKTGLLATWLYASGDGGSDRLELSPRIEFGFGVAEKFEMTLGLDDDMVSLHTGWRF